MDLNLPGIVVTGASGFVGRHFLEAAAGRFRLFCLARRSQFEAGAPRYENQRWMQVDIGRDDAMADILKCIQSSGGADYVLHLAGYYDFSYTDHPEYTRTNVLGTKNVLILAKELRIKRFIFSSSLAACPFPVSGEVITEDTPPSADFPYARSKREGEALIHSFSRYFPCTVLRLAALFSDWCEYPPLYSFLRNWLSDRWNARILGGKGKSAVPYLHINDLTGMILRVIEKESSLPRYCVLNASPSAVASHQQLFEAATKFYFGASRIPLRLPRVLALPGVALRQWLLTMLGYPPFERTWMMRYIDRELRVDASRTHKLLDWAPRLRYSPERRLLILLENLKSHPEMWRIRNEAAFIHAASRPNLVMYYILLRLRDEMTQEIEKFIRREQGSDRLCDYSRMNDEMLHWYVSLFYQVLITSVRTLDRSQIRNYARILAHHRKRQGFAVSQVCFALLSFSSVIRLHLDKEAAPSRDVRRELCNTIDLNIQLAIDEVEDVFEQRSMDNEEETAPADARMLYNTDDIRRIVAELNEICKDGWDSRSIFHITSIDA
jgi:nucleoside-diphosphate-sugar epimerase